jgi:hypothetical protein
MTDHPITFNTPMVRAILDGRKTMTRRMLRKGLRGAPWQPGDTLWVREMWCHNALTYGQTALYEAGGIHTVIDDGDGYTVVDSRGREKSPWRSPIRMPRLFSRISLRVTAVRVERLQDIGEADARAEGVDCGLGMDGGGITYNHVKGFAGLWNSIYGADAWDANPWVSVTTFERITL